MACEIANRDDEFSTVGNSVVLSKFGKSGGGDDERSRFSIMVDSVVEGGGGVGVGIGVLSKNSFDDSSKWFALVIKSCARRIWSLWNESTLVTLRPLLMSGRPLRDSGKCSNRSVWSVVVEHGVSLSWRREFELNVKCNVDAGGGTLWQRSAIIVEDDLASVETTSEPECKRAFNRLVITSSSPSWRLEKITNNCYWKLLFNA